MSIIGTIERRLKVLAEQERKRLPPPEPTNIVSPPWPFRSAQTPVQVKQAPLPGPFGK